MEINLNKIKKDAGNFKINNGNSYIQTYKEFINYFDNLEEIKRENLIIGAHLVYGWMPTILHLNLRDENKVLQILNEAKNKKGKLITIEDLIVLKNAINNSMVGVSKLLHFISPKKYAIWDSKVYRYIYGRENTFQIQQPARYLEYLEEMNRISSENDAKNVQAKVEEECGYKVTTMRAIELVMFQVGN